MNTNYRITECIVKDNGSLVVVSNNNNHNGDDVQQQPTTTSSSKKIISTGIGFLDHMIDQLNSHAQLSIHILVDTNVVNDDMSSTDKSPVDDTTTKFHSVEYRNRYAATIQNQTEIMTLVGQKIGTELRQLFLEKTSSMDGSHRTSRFACPLDEALTVCILSTTTSTTKTTTISDTTNYLQNYTLDTPSYGKYGRNYVGSMMTKPLIEFWKNLAVSSGINIELYKIRGTNAHHIIESSFKAFARAYRNLLDTITTSIDPTEKNHWYSIIAPNFIASQQLHRQVTINRSTKETSIQVQIQLSTENTNESKIGTGVLELDKFIYTLSKSSYCRIDVACYGDIYIDEHHTVEDIAIAIGQCYDTAFGTKAGCNRMWTTIVPIGDPTTGNTVEVTMDLSNRPELVHNINFNLYNGISLSETSTVEAATTTGIDTLSSPSPRRTVPPTEGYNDLSYEMMEHFLESFVIQAKMTVHIVVTVKGDEDTATTNNNNNNKPHPRQVLEAIAIAFGQSLYYCSIIDLRRAGTTASSKGTLAV